MRIRPRRRTGGSLTERGQLVVVRQCCDDTLAWDGQRQWLTELLQSIGVIQDLPRKEEEGR
jgi:hypothetical protein